MVVLMIFYNKKIFSQRSSTLSNSDPDQTQQHVRPDLGLNCMQKLSADDTSRQRFTVIESRKVKGKCI